MKLLSILLLVHLVHSITAQSSASKIDSLMMVSHQAGEFSGTVLVAIDGKIEYRKAFGLADENRPLKENTAFYLGSLAKAFTGMAVMMLAEEKKFSYDSRVHEYFPELPAFMGGITVRNLLNHTSGLPDYYRMGKYKDGMTNKMVFKVILELDGLEFEPGREYSYSNTGYVLLSLLIEHVSHQSYRKFIKERIFKPIGMEHSEIIDGTQSKMPDRALGHTQDGELNDYNAMTTGAGGIYSQIDDIYLWDQALYTSNLVRTEALTTAFTPARLNNGELSYYGYGWRLDRENPHVVQHSGSLAGFRTYLYRDTENKNTIILLSNYSNNVEAIRDEILKLIQD